MKTTSLLLSAAALLCLLLAPGCRVRDVRTATIRVPDLRHADCTNAACAAAVRKTLDGAFKRLPDTRLTNDRDVTNMCLRVEALDTATGDVTVRYDTIKVCVRNLEEALAEAGFDTPTFPANAAARAKNLSAACFAK